MFNIHLNNPEWINQELFRYNSLKDIPMSVFDEVRERLQRGVSKNPKVSICIAAYNEEVNIVRCLDSLSHTSMDVPFEILVVNNNSTDRTQEVLDKLGVRSYFQPIQGSGAARQMSQEKAKGEYILTADADCIYPKDWANILYSHLVKEDVVGVYGRHAFLGDKDVARWKYALYEVGKKVILRIRHFKKPYLNSFGMSMGYVKALGLNEGFDTRNIRGEDGRMCFDLMKYGRIEAVTNSKAIVWTAERNFAKEGGFSRAVKKRLLLESARLANYLKKPVLHDTKTSDNSRS